MRRLLLTIWFKLTDIGWDVPHGPYAPTWREAWDEAGEPTTPAQEE